MNLNTFITKNVVPNRSSFEVSKVKGNGRIFVRFRSGCEKSSQALAEALEEKLVVHDIFDFIREDERRVSLSVSSLHRLQLLL